MSVRSHGRTLAKGHVALFRESAPRRLSWESQPGRLPSPKRLGLAQVLPCTWLGSIPHQRVGFLQDTEHLNAPQRKEGRRRFEWMTPATDLPF